MLDSKYGKKNQKASIIGGLTVPSINKVSNQPKQQNSKYFKSVIHCFQNDFFVFVLKKKMIVNLCWLSWTSSLPTSKVECTSIRRNATDRLITFWRSIVNTSKNLIKLGRNDINNTKMLHSALRHSILRVVLLNVFKWESHFIVMLSVIMISVGIFVVMLSVNMLSVIMLSVIMLSAIMLSVIALSVIILSFIMLSVVTPALQL